MQYLVLEPAYLFGGFPPAELRNKFLMAKPCAVRDVDDSGVPPELADRVLGLCGEGRTFEEVLAGVFALYGLSMDFTQYVLVGSTVRSYLAYLHGKGAVDVMFAEGYGLCGEVSRRKES